MLLWQNDNVKIKNTPPTPHQWRWPRNKPLQRAPRLARGQLPGRDVCGGRSEPREDVPGSKRAACPWISASARVVGHKVSLTSSRHAGLSSQGSPALISAALMGAMVKCRVLLGLKAKGPGTERRHPSRGSVNVTVPTPCRRCRCRRSSPQRRGQSIQGGKFSAPPSTAKQHQLDLSFCERLEGRMLKVTCL